MEKTNMIWTTRLRLGLVALLATTALVAGCGRTSTKKLLNQDRVIAVIGEVASSRSLAAAPSCQEAGVPMISPSSTNPKVTQVGDYVFRMCFIDPFQGTVMAKFAQSLNLKNVAILKD